MAPGDVGQPLRVAVVGTGFIGRVHAVAARRAGAVLVGVSASTPERGRRAAQELGAERAEPAEALVTAADVDVVHVCTPNDLHAPLARRALEAGKHVVCEKPLATTVADAEELAATARRAGRVAAVPFVYRYHPMAWEARERVRSGSVGDVRLVHGSYLQDWLMAPDATDWRVDAGRGGASRAFADIGSHWCDLVEWVTGHRVVELCGSTATVVPERPIGASAPADERPRAVETEDVATVLFRTDRGALGSLVVSQVSPGRKNRLWFEVDAAQASVVFDQEQPDVLWLGDAEGARTLQRDPARLSPEAARLAVLPPGHPQGYQDAFAAFVADVYAAVRGEDVPAYPDFDDAARTVRLTSDLLASASKRSWIEVAS